MRKENFYKNAFLLDSIKKLENLALYNKDKLDYLLFFLIMIINKMLLLKHRLYNYCTKFNINLRITVIKFI